MLRKKLYKHGRMDSFWPMGSSRFKGKHCEVFSHQTSAHLNGGAQSNGDVYTPDLFVVCDSSKIMKSGVYSALDLVAEIIGPSTARIGFMTNIYKAGLLLHTTYLCAPPAAAAAAAAASALMQSIARAVHRHSSSSLGLAMSSS